jgi:hypothetical protein
MEPALNEPLTLGLALSFGAGVLAFALRWIFSGTIARIDSAASKVEAVASTVVEHGVTLRAHEPRLKALEQSRDEAREHRAEDREKFAALSTRVDSLEQTREGGSPRPRNRVRGTR